MFAQEHPVAQWLALASRVYSYEWELLAARDAILTHRLFTREELAVANRMAIRLMAAEQQFMCALEKYRDPRYTKKPQLVNTTFWMSVLEIKKSSGSGQQTE